MDDYPIVLGMKFMDTFKVIPVPFANTMCILENGDACMVPLTRESALQTKSISAMQISEGLREDPKCLPTDIPREDERCKEKFKDGMSDELSKESPQKGEVDQHIKLGRGTKPPVVAPHKMATGNGREGPAAYEFKEGDLVMVKLLPHQFRALKRRHKRRVRRYEGPFPIERRMGKSAYRVKLPQHLKSHPVFHTSLLKPCHGDKKDPSRERSERAPTMVATSKEREIEEVLAYRNIPRQGTHPAYNEYLIKWKGQPDAKTSWERAVDLWQYRWMIEGFHRSRQRDEGIARIGGGGCHGLRDSTSKCHGTF